jgi:uncharacterized protein (TIGR02302 family)
MTEQERIAQSALGRLKWPLRLTRAGIAAERITRGFWPVWTILFGVFAAFAFGLQDVLSLEVLWIGGVATIVAFVWALVRGILRFRWPTEAEAMDRLDLDLPGRPIATLSDRQAIGAGDAGAAAVWIAHVRRMADRTRAARPPAPDLRVAARDPFALRYAALTALVLATLFGSLWRVTEAASIAKGGVAASTAGGPSWEAWVEPPAYTGKPSLYLNEVTADAIEVPEGSSVTVRLYGQPGAVTLTETVSAPKPPAPPASPSVPLNAAKPEAAQADASTADTTPDAPAQPPVFEVARSGTIAIDGTGGRSWAVTVLADKAPTVELSGDIKRDADGRMTQPFAAKDDYGVVAGKATFTLDLAAIKRRYGLTVDPEPREDLVFDLPMPISGGRADFSEALVEDASKHPWANLPVKMTLTVEDGRAQQGTIEPKSLSLPGRRFFDPVANAVIELRRDLLWNRANGARTLQVLKAITNRPEQLVQNERAYLMLRVAMRRLESALSQGPISVTMRDEIAEDFWKIAELIEDGGLSNALARMQQAQERLSEAMKNGASPAEIQRLMDELKQATDDYIQMLAQNMERKKGDGTDERDMSQNQQQMQTITGDQIQQMMDQIQKLMEEGRMAEAQELLDQLQRLMENLKVTEGQGQGQQGPGGKGMQDLQNTLRDQQGLSDDTFGQLQDQFDPGANQPGQRPGQPRGQPGKPGGLDGEDMGQGDPQGGEQGSLAQRQQALRDQLRQQQQGQLPGEGTPEGEAARKALQDAERAMNDAEQALRDQDLPGALDRQAEAIDRLREGLRGLGEAFARQNPDRQGTQGDAKGEAQNEVPRDPLGRAAGANGQLGTDEALLQGKDIYRRAQDLLDEIRRRSADQTRPSPERDYLRRLLDVF